MFFDVTELASQQKYHLLNGGVTPRPIAWISTRSHNNIDNLAPYSFFTVASCNPPVLLYTQVTPRSGVDKDTLQNLLETGECVVNIANTPLLEKMNKTSASLCMTENEFEFAKVEKRPSQTVMPASVKASPVRDDLYNNGSIEQQLIDSVGKKGGNVFSLTYSNLELKRP